MNWDAVGAVGEILSAIAVFITLIYLAIQIRQNTKQLRENEKALARSEVNSLMQNWSDLRRIEMSDSSLAEVMSAAKNDLTALNGADRIRYDSRLNEILWINYHLWERVQQQILPQEEWDRARHLVLKILLAPGGYDVWKRVKQSFSPAFVEEIEHESGSL